MRPKVAAQSRDPDPFPSFLVWARGNSRLRRRRWVPGGTIHVYVEGEPATACGLALETLTLFPEIDWPGGVALTNPRCGTCGESVTS